MLKSPIHCYDEGKISMPDHKRDADGYLCLGQYVSLFIETRGNRTVVYPSHEAYSYTPSGRPAAVCQTLQDDVVRELKRRICCNLGTYSPSKLWNIEKYLLSDYDGSTASLLQLAQIAGESLLPDESETVEYKSCESGLNRHEVMLTICAFANCKGGKLTLGVTDDKKIVGCQHLIDKYGSMDKFSGMLRNLIKQSICTNLYLDVQIEFEHSADKILCHINVPQSPDITFVKDEHLYVRSGNTSQKLIGYRMLNFIKDKYEKKTK